MKKSIVSYHARSNGLGNRLRALLGARILADATDRLLFVVWPTGSAFQPGFADLYQGRIGTPVPLTLSQALARVFPYHDENLTDIRQHDATPVWQIRTGSALQLPAGLRDWEDDLRALRPIAPIADRIRATHDAFESEPYVGVQVRSHAVSPDKTLTASPVEWFSTRLDEVRAAAPEIRFFLSCDRRDIQMELLERYPGSWALDDKGGYNSVLGVQSAVADAYLLASAGYIIGPAHSSFVELAVRLAGHAVPFENSLKKGLRFDPTALTSVADPLRPADRAGDAT